MRTKPLLLVVLVLGVLGAVRVEAERVDGRKSPSVSKPKTVPLKTLWDFQEELGLSDRQVQKMKSLLARFQSNLVAAQKRLCAAESQLKVAIDREAPIDQVREKLARIGSIQLEMRLEDVETSRKVNAVLTEDQLENWRKIQAHSRGTAQ